MATTTWDAKDVTITVDGVVITGLGEDMVTGEKDEEFFSTSVGAQGEPVKSIIHNDLGTVTVTVQKTSPQYGYLLGLAKQAENFPLYVVNKAIGEKFGGSEAALKNYPSSENSGEHSDAEFEFQVFDYEHSVA